MTNITILNIKEDKVMSHIYSKIYDSLEKKDDLPSIIKLINIKNEFIDDYDFNDKILITFFKSEILKLNNLGKIDDALQAIQIIESETDIKLKSEYIISNIMIHL